MTSSVVKKEINHTYWVYAHVESPRITVCQEVPVESLGTELKYRTVTKKREVTRRISLWDFLVLKWKEYHETS